MSFAERYRDELRNALDTIDTNQVGQAIEILAQARAHGRRIFVCGNGGAKPRQLIFYLAHLEDTQRMFFLTLLLEEVLSWTRKQPGSPGAAACYRYTTPSGLELRGAAAPVGDDSPTAPAAALPTLPAPSW